MDAKRIYGVTTESDPSYFLMLIFMSCWSNFMSLTLLFIVHKYLNRSSLILDHDGIFQVQSCWFINLCVAVSCVVLFLIMIENWTLCYPESLGEMLGLKLITKSLLCSLLLCVHINKQIDFNALYFYLNGDQTRFPYYKKDTYMPHEWAHMMVIIFFSNIWIILHNMQFMVLTWEIQRSKWPVIRVRIWFSCTINLAWLLVLFY